MENKIFKKMLLVGLVGMLLIGMIPNTASYQNSLKVIVTVEDKTYNVGDIVNITVHVFDKGEYVSADDVNVTAGWDPVTYTPRYVEVTQTSTGIYEGTYTIQPADEYVSISTHVTKGTDDDYGFVSITVGEEVGLSAAVKLDDPSDYYAQPGDAVEMTVTVKQDDTNVNADTLNLIVNDEPLSYTNPSIGVYKATYNIAPGLTTGKRFEIKATAYKDDKQSGVYSTSFYVLFYNVWYYNITLTNTSSIFELYVADLNGNAVSGATVNISYNDDYNWETPDVYMENTTDSNSKATFSISYTEQSYLWIKGKVSYAGKTQEFEGYLDIPTAGPGAQQPQPEGFDIIYTDKGCPLGETVTRNYTAYYNGAVWANKEVYYYITDGWSAHTIVKYGKMTTDNDGKFMLSFTMPEEPAYICFEAGTPREEDDYSYDEEDNLTYRQDFDWGYPIVVGTLTGFTFNDTNISISVDSLIVGGKTNITVTAVNVPSDAFLYAAWIPYGIHPEEIYYAGLTGSTGSYPKIDWACWCGMGVGCLTKTNGVYTGEIVIPEFMPTDCNYTIAVYWFNETEWHCNHVILKPGESAVVVTTTSTIVGGMPINIYYNGTGVPTVRNITITQLASEIPAAGVAENMPSGKKHVGLFISINTTGTVGYVNITVHYNETDVAGFDEATFRMYYWNETLNEWVICENTCVDVENNIVWANVTHLTIFAPMAEEVAAAPVSMLLSPIYLGVAAAIIAVLIISVAVVARKRKK